MTKLTVSQGLRRIKKLKGAMAEHGQRASQSVSYVQGSKPVFDFASERAKRTAAQDELVRLEAAVAQANAMTSIPVDGKEMTMAEAIRRLQELKADMAWIAALPLREETVNESYYEYDEGTGRNVPRTRSITHVSDLSLVGRVAEIDALRERFDRLNDALETANHRTELQL